MHSISLLELFHCHLQPQCHQWLDQNSSQLSLHVLHSLSKIRQNILICYIFVYLQYYIKYVIKSLEVLENILEYKVSGKLIQQIKDLLGYRLHRYQPSKAVEQHFSEKFVLLF